MRAISIELRMLPVGLLNNHVAAIIITGHLNITVFFFTIICISGSGSYLQ